MACKSLSLRKLKQIWLHRSNESPEWESMTHFLEQLAAHDPSHHKREVLDPRFSEPEMLFPMDVEAKELQSCSTFSITEIQFRWISWCDPCTILMWTFGREKLNFGQEKKKLDAERSLPPLRRRPSSGGRCGFGWLWNGGPCLCGQNCTLASFEKPWIMMLTCWLSYTPLLKQL